MTARLPNIVWIVLDTTGAKHMSLYGYERETTPNLERLSKEFRVFTRCFAPSCWTVPSHASMFTGLYPSEHGAHEITLLLDQRCRHLVTILKQLGYRTCGFSANSMVSNVNGLCRDFDQIVEFDLEPIFSWMETPENKGRQGFLEKLLYMPVGVKKIRFFLQYLWRTHDWFVLQRYLTRWRRRILKTTPFHASWRFTEKIKQQSLSLVSEHVTKEQVPLFLFINIVNNHQMYNPPRRCRKFSGYLDKQGFGTVRLYLPENARLGRKIIEKLFNLYDDEVVYIDIFLKEFIDGLKSIRSFDFDNTMFIITSDHGEHIGEKGHFGHALSLYNELLWVPLLIKFPGNSYAKGPDRRLCTLNDLFATVMEVCESPIPVPRSAVSLIGESQRDSLASMIIDSKFMWKELPESKTGPEWRKKVRSSKFALYLDEGWKIIKGEDNNIEIYNLNSSFSEDSNLVSSLPVEIASQFTGLLDYHQNEVGYNDIITDNKVNLLSD